MRGRKHIGLTILFALASSLISASLTAALLTNNYSYAQFQMLGSICQKIVERQPEIRQTVLDTIKEYKNQLKLQPEENLLSAFGYRQSDFLGSLQINMIYYIGIGFAAGVFFIAAALWYWRRRETSQIKGLTRYLEKINSGGSGLLLEVSEDEFSKLQDEIYKTVTTLYQSRDAALEAKRNFADNLSNIAHQLKTPITAISLVTQMMKDHPSPEYPIQIQKQLHRLTHLEEALLLLSRIDAGTLVLAREKVDVFTVLTLAADNLQELFTQAGVMADIQEMGEVEITADLDWTMEALMNLLKNCMEHAPDKTAVHCAYEKNPLYVQIRIWDEGQGFAKEDIPHIFERFYRGKNARDGGIGIGIPLAKAMIEMQNGMVSAINLPSGGACFEIRIYSH